MIKFNYCKPSLLLLG